MSEKLPQSSPEKQPTTFLVPRSNGEINPATLTGKESYKVALQRDGSKATIKFLEVRFPNTVDESGKSVTNTKIVSEQLLSDGVQFRLAEELHNGLYDVQSSPEITPELNEYDLMLGDGYNINDYSNEGAAERNNSPAVHTHEMLEYSDALLSRAIRADTDLQEVIASAFSQADTQLPHDKEALITSMGSDERIRGQLHQYLRAKAEYYRSDLPERVQRDAPKRPNYPGGEVQPGLDVAAEYAVRMITGEWDQSREDGQVEMDASDNVIRGQHRYAAEVILMSPRFVRREQ